MAKSPVVWSRPDPVTGVRTDITEESKNQKRPDFSAPMPDIPAPVTVVSGQEYVFEFSGPIGSAAAKYISKISKLLGGKRAYIEDASKIVVVL